MKKLKNKLITLRQNNNDYFLELLVLEHEKERQIKIIFNNYKYISYDKILKLTYEYNDIQYGFFTTKKRIEARKRIEELNSAKQDFMKSLNICEDIKRHIYSFL